MNVNSAMKPIQLHLIVESTEMEDDTVYSQNLRTFEELYNEGYIKADTHGVTKSILCEELLGFTSLRAVLTLCSCLEA